MGGGSKGVYRKRTVPVDSFEPNPWGLYNVHGNVDEWTEDCMNDNNTGNSGDGSARTRDNCERVIRGGSWDIEPRYLRSAVRLGANDYSRTNSLGFRVARTLGGDGRRTTGGSTSERPKADLPRMDPL